MSQDDVLAILKELGGSASIKEIRESQEEIPRTKPLLIC